MIDVSEMTAQIPSTMIMEGRVFDIIGLSHGMLFCPEDYGFRPSMIHTACYDGFFARYQILQNELFLDRLTIHSDNQIYPIFNGIAPAPSRQEYGCMVYGNVGLPVPYSGEVRLGKDIIDRCCVNLGYQKPSAYGTVIDCCFDEGILMGTTDRSPDAGAIRGRFKRDFNDLTDGDVVRKIDLALSLGMEFL